MTREEEQPTLRSRRSLTLRFDIPISRTHEFWDALGKGRFVTTRCSACGNESFPPQADCPRCMSDRFEWVDLEREARLVTYTYVQVTPASFVNDEPYIIAIGEFANGIKVLAWLEGVPVEKAKVGMKLTVEARRSSEGNPYYVFVPSLPS
ncbi:MAG: Zn-ribbon domain-containing OB-fold protein [Thaumarchaeota archaeon]|nr:MAG: Zn-ribbon domain-containing OB-fold protein [Nitrososphaerota archaeon]